MAAIKHLFHIAAPQQKVYEAIGTIEGLKNWWTAFITGDEKVGDTIAFRFGGMGPDFKVIELVPEQKVKWEGTAGIPDWIGTTITFDLDQNDGKTRVRFQHDGFANDKDGYAATNFTWGRFMVSLRDYCEKGKGQPFNG